MSQSMTARTLIYALGGGKGHRNRARALAKQLGENEVSIFHQCRDSIPMPSETILPYSVTRAECRSLLRQAAAKHHRLIVDTFEAGLHEEVDQELLDRFPETVWLARYTKQGPRRSLHYKETWLPYCKNTDEWEYELEGIYVGPLVRKLAIDASKKSPIVVIGDSKKIPQGWRELLESRAALFFNQDIAELPAAEKYFCVGAGYNLTFELHALPEMRNPSKVAMVAFDKRYDDQFTRADRFFTNINTTSELKQWLI